MDIHKLRCIVSLARLKNVTRAAEENFIAQSTMSSTLSAIESELGTQLFVRSNRTVSLTLAGESFVAAAEEIVRKYDAAVAEVRRITEGRTPAITIGFNSVIVGSKIGAITKQLHEQHPDLALRFCKHSISKLTECLVDGRADIVFANQFEARKNPESRYSPIAQTHPCVYVPKGHRLSKCARISVSDLRGEYLLCACSDDDSRSLSAAAEVLRNGGIPYTAESPIPNEETILSMVEAGIGLYPAADWYQQALEDRIDCIPLDLDVESMQIVIMWKDETLDEIALDVASITKRQFEHRVS